MIFEAERNDFEELLDFENRVFKIDFSKKVPKVYRYPETAAMHGIYKDKGRIVGAVLVYPGKLVLPQGSLTVSGIPAVCFTAQRFRITFFADTTRKKAFPSKSPKRKASCLSLKRFKKRFRRTMSVKAKGSFQSSQRGTANRSLFLTMAEKQPDISFIRVTKRLSPSLF